MTMRRQACSRLLSGGQLPKLCRPIGRGSAERSDSSGGRAPIAWLCLASGPLARGRQGGPLSTSVLRGSVHRGAQERCHTHPRVTTWLLPAAQHARQQGRARTSGHPPDNPACFRMHPANGQDREGAAGVRTDGGMERGVPVQRHDLRHDRRHPPTHPPPPHQTLPPTHRTRVRSRAASSGTRASGSLEW